MEHHSKTDTIMYTVKHGGDILKGDLVAVCHTNDFIIGIYFGQGRGGTFQYFTPQGIVNAKEYYENRLLNHGIQKEGTFKINKLWKSYVNSPRETRIMKLNRENITDQKTREDIEKAKEILQELNITVNY